MKNLSIGRKLGIAFSMVIAIFICSAVGCFHGIARIGQMEQESDRLVRNQLAIRDADLDYMNIVWSMLGYSVGGWKENLDWKNAHVKDFQRDMGRVQYFQDAHGNEEAKVREALRAYDTWIRDVVEPVFKMRATVDAKTATMDDLDHLLVGLGSYLGTGELLRSTDELVALEQKEADEHAKEAQRVNWLVRTGLFVAVVLAAAAAALIGRWVVILLRNPIKDAVRTAEAIALGHLDSAIVPRQDDETGTLLRALQRMQSSLAGIVASVASGAESLRQSSNELAVGHRDLSSRTESQAASLEQTAASMTELTDTVNQTADNARHAHRLVTSATDLVGAGNVAVSEMILSIETVSGSSEKISEITSMIEGIAFQTNILALNAAVEAARAGDQGRGFAVVANEVRALAQRSATAAKEIKELIGSSVTLITESSQQASRVRETMIGVVLAIKQASEIVDEIAAATAEQSKGIGQVNEAVHQMDRMTQQNAALVEQASAVAQSVRQQATSLTEVVATFKFGHNEAPLNSISH